MKNDIKVRYRNGVDVHRAMQFTGDNVKECLAFCPMARNIIDVVPNLIVTLREKDKNVDFLCNLNDWIVDMNGLWYVYTPSAFAFVFKIVDDNWIQKCSCGRNADKYIKRK